MTGHDPLKPAAAPRLAASGEGGVRPTPATAPIGARTKKSNTDKPPPCRLKSEELPLAQQTGICEWARLIWAQGGTVSVVTDGSYKERVHLEVDGRLHWASSAGCAWVVKKI